jgi:DNA recombination protein RmuC
MTDPLGFIAFGLLAVAVILLLVLVLRRHPAGTSGELTVALEVLKSHLEKLDRTLREEFARSREETQSTLRATADSLQARVVDMARLQAGQLDTFAQQLGGLTQATEQKLEKIRQTVDEKLHATLEQRLGESFRLVSERLEQVQLGLGEMRTLANGVGDLKRVLTNVKVRGTWGEVQLGALLEQFLTPDQYATNVATKEGSNDRVEFAVKLPGRDDQPGSHLWLPVDAKFPQEDYQRLVDAQDQANPAAVEEYSRQLENRIKLEAKAIHDKYVDPPRTTDFAILFLPTEGLYAEVQRRPGLVDSLQRDWRISVAGPTTLAAYLNIVQLGFRTLAIEKRSGEVWSLLGAVKAEFGKFGDVLDKTQKKLQEASTTIEDAGKRTRQIERKLRDVQELPAPDALKVLGQNGGDEEES